MKKEVTLTITGLHENEGENHNLESKLPANYIYKDGKHLVLAKEEVEGSVINLRLTFDTKTLEVRRSGEVVTELVFENDRVHETMYRTPFGAIPVRTETREYYLNEKDIEKGLLEGALKYKLFVDGNANSDATLVFRVETT